MIHMWEETDIKELNDLVNGLLRRVQACFDAEGWYTKHYDLKFRFF